MYKIKKNVKNGVETITGHLGFICPECLGGDIIKGTVKAPERGGVIKMTCPKCGANYKCTSFDIIDPNMMKVLTILNNKGYTTKACCEGHHKNDESYIYFKNLEDEKVLETNPLPDSWYRCRALLEDYGINNFIIRSTIKISKRSRISKLEKWALSLPEKETVDEFKYFYTH